MFDTGIWRCEKDRKKAQNRSGKRINNYDPELGQASTHFEQLLGLNIEGQSKGDHRIWK